MAADCDSTQSRELGSIYPLAMCQYVTKCEDRGKYTSMGDFIYKFIYS